MRTRFRVAALIAAAATLAFVGLAVAAYTSPKLEVTQAGNAVTIKASQSGTDDATAVAQIFAPAGTQVNASQAPGTVLGKVVAQVTALALGGALLPLEGQLVVAAPGEILPETELPCTQGAAPTARWLMVLTAAGQELRVPVYVMPVAPADASLGAAKLLICLPPPGVPSELGGATFGAKLLSAQMTIAGVFTPVPAGAWVALWTPWTGDVPPVNPAGTVATPAAIAPGAVTLRAKRVKKTVRSVVSGVVTQGGQGRGGVTVQIWAGAKRTGLKRIGSVKAKGNGTYAFRARAGTFFRARAVAAATPARPLCAVLTGQGLPFPCVNPTANGFVVQSGIVRTR